MEPRDNSQTHKAAGDVVETSGAEHKYKYDTPEEHLRFLLRLGWAETSPLIQKYRRQHNLHEKQD